MASRENGVARRCSVALWGGSSWDQGLGAGGGVAAPTEMWEHGTPGRRLGVQCWAPRLCKGVWGLAETRAAGGVDQTEPQALDSAGRVLGALPSRWVAPSRVPPTPTPSKWNVRPRK